MTAEVKRILALGGAGFLGSLLVDELVSRGHEVEVIDDLSSCWMAEDGLTPRFRNAGARYYKPEELRGPPPDYDALAVLSLRHPLERERVLYELGVRGFLHLPLRIFFDLLNARAPLSRVVVAGTAEENLKKPNVSLAAALRATLGYWHRPTELGVYFMHLPELNGPRRLPEAPIPEGAEVYTPDSAIRFMADLLDGTEKHKVSPDVYPGRWLK